VRAPQGVSARRWCKPDRAVERSGEALRRPRTRRAVAEGEGPGASVEARVGVTLTASGRGRHPRPTGSHREAPREFSGPPFARRAGARHALHRAPHRAGRRRARPHAGDDRRRLARRARRPGDADVDPVRPGRLGPRPRTGQRRQRTAARGDRAAGPRGAARPRRVEHRAHPDARARVPRHRDPAGDPAQRPRGPGLVHRLHALPAGDLPGSARGAAELPDRRVRPDRSRRRRCLDARRVHGRRRGDAPAASRGQVGVGHLPGRRRHAPADDRRPADPGGVAEHQHRARRRRRGERSDGE